MGRFGRKPTSKSERPSADETISDLLKDAAMLLQRSERRRGEDALSVCQQSVAKYRQALARDDQLQAGEADAAHFGAGEALQRAAELVIEASRLIPDELARAQESRAAADARHMLTEAVEHYGRVRDGAGGRSAAIDALVNGANALAALAEVEAPEQRLGALEKAAGMYRAALRMEEDALIWQIRPLVTLRELWQTHSNLGDTLVSAAERMAEAGEPGRSRQVYAEAFAAYEAACALSSTDAGDDLPGLLHNWGVGLHSAGVRLQDMAALEESAAKLRHAAGFARGDAAPLNALGDTLCAAADLADVARRPALLERALADGYAAALRIDRANPDGLVGSAEAELALGRGKGGAEALDHFRRSAAHYAAALQHPHKLGDFAERSEIRYNYACAAALAGDLQAAEAVLRSLLQVGGVAAAEVIQDADLGSLRESSLLAELQRGLT